jgi:hypothetical protein
MTLHNRNQKEFFFPNLFLAVNRWDELIKIGSMDKKIVNTNSSVPVGAEQ